MFTERRYRMHKRWG